MGKNAFKTKLSDLATVLQGQSPESSFYSTSEGTPFLQGNKTFGHLFPSFSVYTKKVTHLAKKGDVLMSVRAPVGDLNFAPCDLCIGRGIASIKAKNGNNNFVYYALKYNIKNLLKQGAATTFDSVNKDVINEFELVIPKDETSRFKASFALSLLDSKIELNNRINTELESTAKTIFDYWFVQFDFPDSKGKPYKSSGGKMVWNEKLKREIPEGWSSGTLLDIAEYTNGLPCQKYRPKGDDVLRVIKIKEMHEGFSEETELVDLNIPQKAIIENGDILFSWSASLEVQIWSKGKGALNQHIFKVTSEQYPKFFYYYQLLNYLHHFRMMAANRKTTMGHITQEHLEQSRIALPPEELKELLLECEYAIEPIFNKMISNNLENQQLSELRDWLLPMLMNGQITVK